MKGVSPPNRHGNVVDVERPGKFEDFRWVGDKRSLIVYDVDNMVDPGPIEELMESGAYASFGPDTLAEARNRGFTPFNGSGSDTAAP